MVGQKITFSWRLQKILLQSIFNTQHHCSQKNAQCSRLLLGSACDGSPELVNWWSFPAFTELLSSNLCVLMAGFLYMLTGFQLSLIILASFGGYWLVHPSGLGDLLASCEPHKAISGISYVPD